MHKRVTVITNRPARFLCKIFLGNRWDDVVSVLFF